MRKKDAEQYIWLGGIYIKKAAPVCTISLGGHTGNNSACLVGGKQTIWKTEVQGGVLLKVFLLWDFELFEGTWRWTGDGVGEEKEWLQSGLASKIEGYVNCRSKGTNKKISYLVQNCWALVGAGNVTQSTEEGLDWGRTRHGAFQGGEAGEDTCRRGWQVCTVGGNKHYFCIYLCWLCHCWQTERDQYIALFSPLS